MMRISEKILNIFILIMVSAIYTIHYPVLGEVIMVIVGIVVFLFTIDLLLKLIGDIYYDTDQLMKGRRRKKHENNKRDSI